MRKASTVTGKALVMAAILSAAVSGCATPIPADMEYAGAARRSIASTLGRFAKAVRNKDVGAASALISPDVSFAQRARMELAIKQAVWIDLYAGYRLDTERAVARAGWRSLRDGRAELEVRATNVAGVEFRDTFVAERRDSEWVLSAISLREPVAYEKLDPPPEAAREISVVLGNIFANLKQEKIGQVLVMLPPGREVRFRTTDLTFWQRLFGAEPASYSIDEDLNTLCSFTVLAWPDPAKDLPLAYVTLDTVVACYDIPYVWYDSGIPSQDNLRMEIFLRLQQGEWRLLTFRLYGEGIPGSTPRT